MKRADLQRALRAADEAAVLVSPRIIERIIQQIADLPALHWGVPHADCYVVDRQMLFRHAEQADLELEPDQLLPRTVILLARPHDDDLKNLEPGALLLMFWRRLFHASIHFHFEAPQPSDPVQQDLPPHAIQATPLGPGSRIPRAPLTDEDVRVRVETIGRSEFDEIRSVLVHDNYLPANADDRAVYVEFVSVYLEHRYFAANLLDNFFPGLRDRARIDKLLAQDIDAAEIFRRTRLEGTSDPVMPSDTRSDESHEYYWKLLRTAERATKTGNLVRAAILRTTASRVAPAALTESTRRQAEEDMRGLSRRLQAALQWTDAEADEWFSDLRLLLDKADQGYHPVEARLLHDLQNVCIDHEREIFTLDLVEWVLSAGRRPIKRPLPSQRFVRITRHLRNAREKLGAVRLTDLDRQQLGRLLSATLAKSEDGLRARFGPVFHTAMHDVGLTPQDPPEAAAFKKVVEELLDRIAGQGFLTFGDLRDTLSRNQLKLPDLTEPQDFLRGDALLRLDRRLASLLDGVYRPAEFYMRWLERFTSWNFGTPLGRTITMWFTVPFLGAVVTLALLLILAHKVDHRVDVLPTGKEEAAPAAFYWAVYGTGLPIIAAFLIGLIHGKRFRAEVGGALHAVGAGLRAALIDWPARAFPWASIRRVVTSWPFQVFMASVVKPGILCLLIHFWLPAAFDSWPALLVLFLLLAFILNSRVGQAVNEAASQTIVAGWALFQGGLIIGLYRWIVLTFKQVLDTVDRFLFGIDEWLRFRSGESRLSLVVRTVLSVLWYPIGYVSRFYFVVLIEPCINPIKLAISILAAKFVYPLLLLLGWFQADPWYKPSSPFVEHLDFLSYPVAWVLVIGTLYLLPDAFAFLFWEMRENWRLYRANRPRNLKSLPVGGHGETVRGLLQPGFHSGTVPKLYSHLRQAEREAYRTRNWQTARYYRHELHEIRTALQRFVNRELVAVLAQSASWKPVRLEADRVDVATNRIDVTLLHPSWPSRPVELSIELRGRLIVAGMVRRGWYDELTPERKRSFESALACLYKLAEVDIVVEQVRAALPKGVEWELSRDGSSLTAWPSGPGPAVRYVLDERLELLRPVLAGRGWRDVPSGISDRPSVNGSENSIVAPSADGLPVVTDVTGTLSPFRGSDVRPVIWPDLKPESVLFRSWPLSWAQWAELWHKDQQGLGHAGLPGLDLGLNVDQPPPPAEPPKAPVPAL
jgi:hypothetical protein